VFNEVEKYRKCPASAWKVTVQIVKDANMNIKKLIVGSILSMVLTR